MTADVLYLAPDDRILTAEEVAALPGKAKIDARLRGAKAAGAREARRKLEAEYRAHIEKADLANAHRIAGIHEAQERELDRHTKLIGKGAHRDGVLQGVLLGMLIAVGIGCLALLGYNQVMAMRVAIGRVPQASVPAITDTYQDAPYERGAREPGSLN